jgi:hypothetical protein
MTERDEEIFAPYESYLDVVIWPSMDRQGEVTYTLVEEMQAPQHAASALAKLVRWARYAPVGDICRHPDEDSREEAARDSRLGHALAARALNLSEEHFHALYGEYGATPDADPHQVLAELAVALGDYGLGDWNLQQRIRLAASVLERLATVFAIKERT